MFAIATPAAGQPGAPDPAQAKKQEHLQKIRQLMFDRRPTSILKAWSTPKEEAIKEASNDASQMAPGMPVQVQRAARRVVNNAMIAAQNANMAMPGAAPGAGATAQPDPFDRDLRGLQYDVTLGDWPAVKTFLARLPEDEGKAAYEQLIQALGGPPGMQNAQQMQQMQMQMQQMQMQMNMNVPFGVNTNTPPNPQQFMMEKNVVSNADVLALAGLAPHGLDAALLEGLGRILRLSLDSGNVIEDFLARLHAAVKLPKAEAPLTDRQAVKVLVGAGCTIEAGEFLPGPEKAEADNDREALNLLARHYMALHARDKRTVHLERAWKVTQAALAAGTIDRAQKEEAIRRAVELTPKLREALGRAWLEESFTSRPERGMEIIANIGAATAQGMQTHAFDADYRLKSIELQKLAVEALLAKAPQLGKTWGKTLALLADAWLREAEFSYHYDYSTSLGPRMYYDNFGNVFYNNYNPFDQNMMMRQRGGMPTALRVGDVVKERPGDAWMASVDRGIKPKFASVFAKLYLKVNEEDEGVPLHRPALADRPARGQGAGRGVRPRLDQEPRPQLAAAAPQSVLLRLRVREPRPRASP